LIIMKDTGHWAPFEKPRFDEEPFGPAPSTEQALRN